jgi:hypothetical protein
MAWWWWGLFEKGDQQGQASALSTAGTSSPPCGPPAAPTAAAPPAPVAAAAAVVAAFPPWQQQRLAALAQQVLNGQEPSLAQLVSLCLWPQVQQFRPFRVGAAGASPALLAARLRLLHSQRVAYTRAVWEARLLLAGVWLAVGCVVAGGQEGRLLLTRASGEGGARRCSAYIVGSSQTPGRHPRPAESAFEENHCE